MDEFFSVFRLKNNDQTPSTIQRWKNKIALNNYQIGETIVSPYKSIKRKDCFVYATQ